jgi:hypothetical protein
MTWMTSSSVARDRESAGPLRQAAREGDEIAGHLHGWEAPPFADIDRTSRPSLDEHDPAPRPAKHRSLLEALHDAIVPAPASDRSGRWGTDAPEIERLGRLGYRIDSGLAPGIDFRDRGGFRQLGPDVRRHLTAPPLGPHRVGSMWCGRCRSIPVDLGGNGPRIRSNRGRRIRQAAVVAGPCGPCGSRRCSALPPGRSRL